MKYSITSQLLTNIKRITELVTTLNNKRFPQVVLFGMARAAREASAHSSTAIEGNPLPLTEVKKILKNRPENLRQSEREVTNYNNALKVLEKEPEAFNQNLVLKIHGLVMDKLLAPYQTGKYRVEPVVVSNYLPPDIADVRPLMTELLNFIDKNKNIIDPLILAGLFHRQFVIIHPFIDGNGRTCRLLTKVLLARMGLNTFNLFSFENYYNKNVTRYFQTVGIVGNYYDLKEVDHTRWLEYFTEGIIDELLRVQNLLEGTKLQPHEQKIVDYINNYGKIQDRNYAKLTVRAKATRVLDFNKLIKLKMIKRHGKGKNTYYDNTWH
ncbi:MAG: Fic family protein [bacterium]|nr:Fic family protein [bacterium]